MLKKILAWPNGRCKSLCQSAAEKFLKGYLIAQGWTLERTHDIVALLELATQFEARWESMLTEGAVLNEYIVAGRYPGDIVLEEIVQAHASEALDAVRHIRSHLRGIMMSKYDV